MLGRVLEREGTPFGLGDRTLGFLPRWNFAERMF